MLNHNAQTIRFKRFETGTLRERARNKIDVDRDFEILKAKNVFLQNSIDLEEFGSAEPKCNFF